MKKIKIGILGVGYVGLACLESFSKSFEVITYDKDTSKSTEVSLENLIEKANIFFICLPTPMNLDGSCNSDLINDALSAINLFEDKVCVIKSTVPPGTTTIFQKKYKNIKIFYNPEFLTEANFIEDFNNQKQIIVGSSNNDGFHLIETIYKKSLPQAKIINCSYEESEIVKYFINTFLAMKVSFSNEFYTLCKKLEVDYDNIKQIVALDSRVGFSHLSVPGPDGKKGFGGSCFPKDINAIINVFNVYKLNPLILTSVWQRNILLDRQERDWEKLKGRAVISDEKKI